MATVGTATTHVPGGATPTTQAPFKEPGAVDYLVGFLQDRFKDAVKVVKYTADWFGQLMPGPSPMAKQICTFTGDVKNLVSVSQIPRDANKTAGAVGKFFENPSISTARSVLHAGSSLTNNVCDGINLSSRFITIEAPTLNVVNGINYGSTFAGALNGAIENYEGIEKLSEQETNNANTDNTSKKWQKRIDMIRDLFYVALGAAGLAFMVFTPIPYLLLGCATGGLVSGIAGYFHNKICDPNKEDPQRQIHRMEGEIISLQADNNTLRSAASAA